MTLEEKAAFLTGKGAWETADFPSFDLRSMFLADGPHGVRRQVTEADDMGKIPSIPATCFPTAATMANSWNEALIEEMGELLGEEAKAQRVNVLLGPGTNMKRNPRCGRNFEYFSEDPYLAGKMAAAIIRGIQKNGISACVKHFAANNQELRRMANDSVIDERALREIYLTAFEIAVKEGGTKALMSSYNSVNGTYANENEHLLRDILRGEWGYTGMVVSDWSASNDRVAAVKAGSDLEMPSCKYGAEEVVKAVRDGKLDLKYVDECVGRLLDLYESTKIDDNAPTDFDVYEHNRFAKKCAEESIVLLENNGILPLPKNEKIALIGDFAENPRYQGAGSSIVNPTVLSRYVDRLLGDPAKSAPKNKEYDPGIVGGGKKEIKVVETYVEELVGYDLNVVGYEPGFDRYGKKDPKKAEAAMKLAETAETVLLFLGLDEVSEAEGMDRAHIRLNENQLELFRALKAAGKKIVVILSCGAPVELAELREADALVYACLSGQACADAVMDVLVGRVNPSGKLAETFPERYEDCPTAGTFPGTKRTSEYRESLFIGYRYYEKAEVKPAYPFGYGLSYTTFEYSGLEVTEEGVKFTLKNTGDRAGAEISELYVGKKDSALIRPVKELKGFRKTFLEAGESAEVQIPFDDKTFRYFNDLTDGWEIEGGTYEIYVGASIDDVRLQGTLEKTGTSDVIPYDLAELPSYASGKVQNVSAEEFEKLLGRPIPTGKYLFYTKNRMVIDDNCTVDDLRYSKRWAGRFCSWLVRFLTAFSRFFCIRCFESTLEIGIKHQPVRGIAKFLGFSRRQKEGMLRIFNGQLFKGLGMILFKPRKNRLQAEK